MMKGNISNKMEDDTAGKRASSRMRAEFRMLVGLLSNVNYNLITLFQDQDIFKRQLINLP
jgi:hypothetical protein